MKQLIIYLLLLVFAMLPLAGCTNDETGEDLEILTPNETEETTAADLAVDWS